MGWYNFKVILPKDFRSPKSWEGNRIILRCYLDAMSTVGSGRPRAPDILGHGKAPCAQLLPEPPALISFGK